MLELYIGNKCFSSWSLRPWLALKHHDIPFTEKFVRLRQPDTTARILVVSPSGRVPVLHHDGRRIWDTLAILEYLAELHPEMKLWPDDRSERAMARSVAAEMHSGFMEVRSQWGMNLRRAKAHKPLTEAGQKQAARIEQIWRDCRAQFGAKGPFLFGGFTAADAMYAPVVSRFDTYGGPLAADTRAYVDTILAMPAMKEWYAGAAAEPYPEPNPDE
jgi:glutathione S-transferase